MKYTCLLTDTGKQLLTQAITQGSRIDLTHMSVGDGNGHLPIPATTQTQLTHEVYRTNINQLTRDTTQSNWLIAEMIIPKETGGWWIREIGLFDSAGRLFAVGNVPETYKPLRTEGASREQIIQVIVAVSDTQCITLMDNPGIVMATLDTVKTGLAEHEKSRNHPDATLTEKGFTQLSSEVTSPAETMAATPKAVKIAMDNANARLAKERNGADIPSPALFRQNIELGNSATLNVGTTINTVAAGNDSRFTSSAQKANNLSDLTNPDDAVKNLGLTEWINKVNDTQIGRPNQSLIEINTPDDLSNLPAGARRFAQNATGVSVLPTNAYFYLEVIAKRDTENGTAIWAADANNPGNVWLGVRYNTSTDLNFTWSKQYSTQNKPTAADVGAVPATRTINGKPLTTNISLSYSDVRAVSYMCTVNGKYLDGNPVLTAADVGAVPTTRTVNGKALSTNITLTAADIGVVIPSIPFIPKNTALTVVNGWWKCGDTGLIIQWGIVPASSSNTLNHRLPMTFPNKGLWALGQSYWAMPYGVDDASGSAALFDNDTIRVTTDNGVPTAWIAIGY